MKKKYGLFVKGEYELKYIFDLFYKTYNLPSEDFIYTKNNIILCRNKTIEEGNIKEFDVLLKVKPRLDG